MNIQKKIEDKVYRIITIIIVIYSLFSMLYFGWQKNGYHVDEIYSYGLANSEYLPFMHFGNHDYDVKDWMNEYGAGESPVQMVTNLVDDYRILKECDFDFYSSPIYRDYLVAQENSTDTKTTTWVSGEDYLHYIAVSPENTFNYASVYYNQRGDVHPPFFYLLLHTVCSIFQGYFSKWFGLTINILFMLMTMRVLYKLCSEFCGGKLVAVPVLAMYGFSSGFMTTAMFIRMYAILTFFVVTSCYLHLRLADNDFRISRKERWKLLLVTLLGFLTHYYFVIYAIGMAVVFSIWMLARRLWKSIIRYILTLTTSAIIGICVWPFAIKHVFFGYRGRGSFQALLQVEAYLIKIKLMLQQIFGPMLDGNWWILLLAVLTVTVIAVLTKTKKIAVGRTCLITIPIIFYVLAVSQIVPFYTDRYVMCAYPFVCIILSGSVYHSIRMICTRSENEIAGPSTVWLEKCKQQILTGAMIIITVVVFLLNNCYMNMPGYMFPEGQELVEVPENTDCIFVLPDGDWNESAEESSILAKCRRVGVVYESNLSVLQADYEYCSGDYLMVYIQKNMDIESVLSKVHDTFGTGDLHEISRENSGSAVRILLSDR